MSSQSSLSDPTALRSGASATTVPFPSPAARPLRLALCLVPLLFVGVWGLTNQQVLYEGAAELAGADPVWLLAGLGFTCLGWVAASCMRQGACPDPLPPRWLLASQFAAGAANHVLPAGLGAHAVTLRFLRGRGVPLERATASLALYSLVKPVAKTLVLLVLLAVSPAGRQLGALVPDGHALVTAAVVAGVIAVTACLLLRFVHALRRPLIRLLHTALSDARLLHRRPRRVLALWGGATAMPLLQACTLASVGQALGIPVPWTHVVVAYLAAGTAVGAVPAPGGLAVDAALVFTLIGFGAPTASATATVIGFRVLTDWLPLLPGALVLSALMRAKVL